jgi:serine/threonine protein kinase
MSQPAASVPSEPLIDGWRLLGVIGQGSDGVVYRAHREGQPRQMFALKVSRRDPARLCREWVVLRELSHPNIVAIRGARPSGLNPFIVMDLIDGPSLGRWMREGPMDAARARVLFTQAVEAIAYLHRRGLYHRDIKPNNFVVDRRDGQLRLVDFGHVHGSAITAITEAGLVCGTLNYLPPEWDVPEADDARRDVYALGVMLYEMIEGHSAFPVDPDLSVTDRMAAYHQLKATAKLDVKNAAPRALRELILAMTSPDPEKRPHNADAVRRELLDLPPERSGLEGARTLWAALTRAAWPIGRAVTPR